MTGAMYAAISGMKSHMSKLNVIGNNIANVNTYGYKTARTTFSESLYTSMRAGSNGSATAGGMNPAQIGYGCNIGTIDLDMGSGQYVPTGVGLDCMIDGDGFFFVGDKGTIDPTTGQMTPVDPSTLNLTRVGNFTFDQDGYLVDGNGSVVYGFVPVPGTQADADSPVVPGAVPGAIPPNSAFYISTQLVPIRMPMAAVGSGTAGADYIAPGTAIFPGLVDGTNVYPGGTGGAATTGETITYSVDSISIDGKTGQITCTNNADKSKVVVGYIPLAKVDNPNGVTHLGGPYYGAGPGAGRCVVAAVGNIVKGQRLNNADDDTNGDPLVFGTGETVIRDGGLESSGTDVATEFSEMITTQRGYQANTRIITVTDTMLEELVNLKR